MIKTVDIKELKANHPDIYQKEHERYCQSQWELPLEDDFYIDSLNENNHWLDVDKIHYSISYSQGDYAFFTGGVDLIKFLDEFDKDNEYFVLREAIKLKDCFASMGIGEGYGRGSQTSFGDIDWCGDPFWEEGDVVKSYAGYTSILEGMNYDEYQSLCATLIGDLHAWVKGVCERLFRELYKTITDEIDYQMSEEAFDEWAESLDEQVEVEVDDEPEGHDSGHQGERLAA